MPSPLSSALRSINRTRDSKLNILTSPTHEGYETRLCTTGHNFYALMHPQLKRWDTAQRPIPHNYTLLNGSQHQLTEDVVFDLILSQQKWSQHQILSQIAKQINCAMIQLEHTAPLDGQPPHIKFDMQKMRGSVDVFISSWSVGAWGFDPSDSSVRVIEHGIDENKFKPWDGESQTVLSVVNGFKERGSILGYDIWCRVSKGFNTKLVGHNPGVSNAIGEDAIADNLSSARVFLNTSLQSTYPMSLIEAMMAGCPVVTTATCAIPSFIINGVNGYCTNNEWEMRKCVQKLLDDKELAQKIGEAGRQTAITRFGISRFVKEWNDLFFEVAEMRGFS